MNTFQMAGNKQVKTTKNSTTTLIVLALIGLGLVLLWQYSGLRKSSVSNKEADLQSKFTACRLSSQEGELVSIMQGTVATVVAEVKYSVGLMSVAQDKAWISVWDPSDISSERKISLGLCEKFEVQGGQIYVLSIDDRAEGLFAKPGSSHDSVDLFVVRSSAK
ncbi:MAG: hypothetical protein V1821_00400 [bacterium]